jgi:hypothetical protein
MISEASRRADARRRGEFAHHSTAQVVSKFGLLFRIPEFDAI